jgi:serine/threonine-protein kinase
MSDEFQIGRLIDGTPYRVVRLIGKGGMGSVYEVEHRELGKRFVLKALLRQFISRRDLVQRLRNEWRALGRLEHPNIVSVTDAGVAANRVPYYVMERLVGETLAQRIRDWGRMPVIEALDVAAGVLDGLSAAHAIDVVHRDIKPPNIFLTKTCVPKVLDFGIAKLLDGTVPLTSRGVAIGTPRYISPEQAQGEKVDARADLYAVGLLLYEMLSGESPFENCESDDLLVCHLTRVPERLSTLVPGIPSELDHLVARLLAKKPDDRPRNARGAAEVIRAIARGLGADRDGDTLARPLVDALTPMGELAEQAPPTLRDSNLPPAIASQPPISGDAPTVPAEWDRASNPSSAPGSLTTPTELLEELPVEDLPPTNTAVPSPVPSSEGPPSMPPWGISAPAPRAARRASNVLAIGLGTLGAVAAVLGLWLLAPRSGGDASAASQREVATPSFAASPDAVTSDSVATPREAPRVAGDQATTRIARAKAPARTPDAPEVHTSPREESPRTAESDVVVKPGEAAPVEAPHEDSRQELSGITNPWEADSLAAPKARKTNAAESSEAPKAPPSRVGGRRLPGSGIPGL